MSSSIIVKGARLSYMNVFKPRAGTGENSKPRYSVSLILPKNHPQIPEIKQLIREEIEAKWPDPKKRPNNLHIPLRDGDVDRANDIAYADSMFINAACDVDRRPKLIDGQRQEVKSDEYWASGDYGNVKIDLYPFVRPEKKGIGVGLVTVQFVRKGEPLGNRTDPMEGFENVEEVDAEDPQADIFK